MIFSFRGEKRIIAPLRNITFIKQALGKLESEEVSSDY